MKLVRILAVFMFVTAFATGAFAWVSGDFANYKVGDFTVIALADVIRDGNTNDLIGYTPEQKAKLTPDGKVKGGVNAFVVKTGDKIILVDTGLGKTMGGNVAGALQKAGITPDKVNLVILTHMHVDHVSGLVADGKPVFTNAEVWVSAPEKEYWYDNSKMRAAPRGSEGSFIMARDALDPYGKKVKTFQFGTEIVPGIRSVAAVGHTPGHTAYMVTSGSDKLLIWGDIVHVVEVQFPLPGVAIKYDVDPKTAVETRKQFMKDAADGNYRIAGMHLPFPGVGKVTKSGDGYKWNPEEPVKK